MRKTAVAGVASLALMLTLTACGGGDEGKIEIPVEQTLGEENGAAPEASSPEGGGILPGGPGAPGAPEDGGGMEGDTGQGGDGMDGGADGGDAGGGMGSAPGAGEYALSIGPEVVKINNAQVYCTMTDNEGTIVIADSTSANDPETMNGVAMQIAGGEVANLGGQINGDTVMAQSDTLQLQVDGETYQIVGEVNVVSDQRGTNGKEEFQLQVTCP